MLILDGLGDLVGTICGVGACVTLASILLPILLVLALLKYLFTPRSRSGSLPPIERPTAPRKRLAEEHLDPQTRKSNRLGTYEDWYKDQLNLARGEPVGERPDEQPSDVPIRFCPSCGKSVSVADRFCKYCGEAIFASPDN